MECNCYLSNTSRSFVRDCGFLISIYSVRLSKKRFDIQQRVEQDRLDSKKKADLRIGLTKVPSSSRKKAFKDVLLIENHGQALARNIRLKVVGINPTPNMNRLMEVNPNICRVRHGYYGVKEDKD